MDRSLCQHLDIEKSKVNYLVRMWHCGNSCECWGIEITEYTWLNPLDIKQVTTIRNRVSNPTAKDWKDLKHRYSRVAKDFNRHYDGVLIEDFEFPEGA